ncbi:MAG: glutamyl-tRNA reductase [Acidimicrobiales bacterium]
MSVIVVGLNHRTAPLELLERVTVPAARLPKALADLRGRDTLDEVVVLSTCMRTEVWATAERFHPAVQDIRNFFCESSFSVPEDVGDHMTILYDDAAIGHLFSVASGLDSAVLGESEVLGQVRAAWDVARKEGTAGPVLSGLFRKALEVGKRVRSETGISRGTASVSQAAVELAAHHLETPLAGRRILVLGAGDMGEAMAVALAGAEDADVQVANRTPARARALARRIGGRAVGLEDLPAALEEVDVLLTSTGSPEPLLTVDDLAPVLARRSTPLLIVDIAVPRDVELDVRALDGVTVLDLDDLRAFARSGLEERRREVNRVHSIIDEEVAAYLGDALAREAAPTVAALHTKAEDIREAELERFRARLDGLDARQQEAVEALTRGILGKLLHDPTVRLKDAAGTPRGERMADTLRTLFDLE